MASRPGSAAARKQGRHQNKKRQVKQGDVTLTLHYYGKHTHGAGVGADVQVPFTGDVDADSLPTSPLKAPNATEFVIEVYPRVLWILAALAILSGFVVFGVLVVHHGADLNGQQHWWQWLICALLEVFGVLLVLASKVDTLCLLKHEGILRWSQKGPYKKLETVYNLCDLSEVAAVRKGVLNADSGGDSRHYVLQFTLKDQTMLQTHCTKLRSKASSWANDIKRFLDDDDGYACEESEQIDDPETHRAECEGQFDGATTQRADIDAFNQV